MKINQTVREAAKRNNVKLWQIAAYMGISEPTMTRLLRQPLPPDKEKEIMAAICVLTKEVS